ncbi:MAG: dimethyl sulfoxide reductase anchor subunit [Betaproteobacteria bacterium]|nr:dimethyl sulfoxide reductase anchor subunit [Betaproteobacteria bacterium]
MIEVAPSLQRNWDARAAGNFSFGGAGAGALILAALEHALGGPYRLPAAAGLALIATGLCCVWLEIGRPLRAANVLRQPQLSWMSRESLAAPLLFATGIAALWFGGGALAWVTALLAAVFLYCQARMLRAAKGIPAWRNPLIVPLIASSGLCEGLGLWLALAADCRRPGAALDGGTARRARTGARPGLARLPGKARGRWRARGLIRSFALDQSADEPDRGLGDDIAVVDWLCCALDVGSLDCRIGGAVRAGHGVAAEIHPDHPCGLQPGICAGAASGARRRLPWSGVQARLALK